MLNGDKALPRISLTVRGQKPETLEPHDIF